MPWSFIEDGVTVPEEIVRERFFDSAEDAGVSLVVAQHTWNNALDGDASAQELVEETTGVEIIPQEIGFGTRS